MEVNICLGLAQNCLTFTRNGDALVLLGSHLYLNWKWFVLVYNKHVTKE